MKSEPSVFSIEDLKKAKTTWWEGVRNYQARNFMMKDMTVGDLVLFYHSNAAPSGIAGLAEVSKAAQPDSTALQKGSEYFDAKATPENPIWYCVQVKFVKTFKKLLSLEELRKTEGLSDLMVLKKGQRLSVQPVTAEDFKTILRIAKEGL